MAHFAAAAAPDRVRSRLTHSGYSHCFLWRTADARHLGAHFTSPPYPSLVVLNVGLYMLFANWTLSRMRAATEALLAEATRLRSRHPSTRWMLHTVSWPKPTKFKYRPPDAIPSVYAHNLALYAEQRTLLRRSVLTCRGKLDI